MAADAICGAILAGGKSSRMGQGKGGVVLADGQPMLEHVAAPLREVTPQLVILGDGAGYIGPLLNDAAIIPDRFPGEGPLAGLHALLSSGLAENYLVVSCDQALLTPELLRRLTAQPAERPVCFKSQSGAEFDPF